MKNKYGIKGVRVENNRIVYRPYIPVAQRYAGIKVDYRGQLSPPIKLGKVGDPDEKIIAAYLIATEQLKQQCICTRNTLEWLNQHYQASRQFKELSPSSQRSARWTTRILDHPLLIDSTPQTVGKLLLNQVKKPLFQKIIERRLELAQQDGKKGAAWVNREIAYISSMISWGVNYVPDLGIDSNPLLGFRRVKEQPRTRHVTDEAYWQQYHIAAETDQAVLPLVFELTLGLAARGAEALDIKLSDCSEQGILVRRLKGSRHTLIEWSRVGEAKADSRLWKVYQAALARHTEQTLRLPDSPLIITRTGDRLSASGLQSAMQRLKLKMKERGLSNVYWTIHELKHKAITESQDKRLAGHKTESMRNKYDHSIPQFKPPI